MAKTDRFAWKEPESLLRNWERRTNDLALKHSVSDFSHWTRDLALRDLLEDRHAELDAAQRNRLEQADTIFMKGTRATSVPLLVDRWHPWWFRIPRWPGEEMLEELRYFNIEPL